jgi:hypothetical protein
MSNDDYICDEEKSYNEWVKNNLTYISANKQHISVMKKLYMDGFAAGYSYKQKISAEEQLQK